jgi:hypothetical protein
MATTAGAGARRPTAASPPDDDGFAYAGMAFVAGIEAAGLNTLFKGGAIDIAASCPC